MRRLLAVCLLLMLVVAGAALAARGDPQKKLTAADNARAKAMVLLKADLGPGYKATPASSTDDDFYCKALDESDLTLTGEAKSRDFTRGFVFASSYADVYESVADANASWRRGTSAAGQKCLRDSFRQAFRGPKTRFVSFGKLAFPRLAQRSIAFRGVAEQDGVRVYVDLVALQQSRAFTASFFGSALAPLPKAEEVRLARLVAGRMATAMQGAS